MKRSWQQAVRKGLKKGSKYRSKMEESVAPSVEAAGGKYEPVRLFFPGKERVYKPDFVLPNGVVIEVKGWFTAADRQKMLDVKAEHPEIDIRLVLATPHQRLNKTSKTTLAQWCEKHGFTWALNVVPDTWLFAPENLASLAALTTGGLRIA